jgi:nucleotide-binding universal stress UspA family protein
MARLAPVEHRRIVVGVSDSEESMHATAVAAQLVAERGELIFVHVIEVPLEFTLEEPPPQEEEMARREAQELLARCQALAERYGVASRRVLERRHAAGPAIVEAAEQRGADLVVIGGEGRFARAGRIRLGPTGMYVLKHAASRVLVLTAGLKLAAALDQVA